MSNKEFLCDFSFIFIDVKNMNNFRIIEIVNGKSMKLAQHLKHLM